jgi:hypothetical protein
MAVHYSSAEASSDEELQLLPWRYQQVSQTMLPAAQLAVALLETGFQQQQMPVHAAAIAAVDSSGSSSSRAADAAAASHLAGSGGSATAAEPAVSSSSSSTAVIRVAEAHVQATDGSAAYDVDLQNSVELAAGYLAWCFSWGLKLDSNRPCVLQ